MRAAIEIQDVSKRFRLYHEHYSSLKERVIHFGRIPFEDFWALDDIDFEIEEGSTVGIARPQRLGQVDAAEVRRRDPPADRRARSSPAGRLAALLELGAGFHPELTGRENIFMNASILGLSKRGHRRRCSTRSSRSPSSRSSSTCRCGTTRRACTCGSGSRSRSTSIPTSCSSTRCSRSATRRSSASASTASRKFQHEGRTILFVTPRGRPRAPHLRSRRSCSTTARW